MSTPYVPFGIHAIAFALFDANEKIDSHAMRRQVAIMHNSGVDGVCCLGLATEVSKLTETERRSVMDIVAEANADVVPLGITIYGNSAAEQQAQVRHAESVGATWLILQPPMVGTFAGDEYIRFFGRVADTAKIPIAIQNAPAYMGRGLTATEIRDLVTQHPNIRAIKGEGSVVDIKAVIAATEGALPVLNGRGGLELTDNARIGCAGMILAPDIVDHAVAIWRNMREGDEVAADSQYARILPSITFAMQSIESLLCYGKRIFAARAGFEIFDRSPALRPTPTGLELVARHADALGPYPTSSN
ncbi:MAG: dihydrodipicolinate synthase family protein [Hyphomicrobiaceae bacterium]|nr:dihydrodipicolinate synthase family protein [Hyphomicrobiaceae bacterium]